MMEQYKNKKCALIKLVYSNKNDFIGKKGLITGESEDKKEWWVQWDNLKVRYKYPKNYIKITEKIESIPGKVLQINDKIEMVLQGEKHVVKIIDYRKHGYTVEDENGAQYSYYSQDKILKSNYQLTHAPERI